ncbi:MAG TPA: hypothetical protein VLR92_04435, partial [Blastocatellia bacterium]|nr:hypothetical protein [Blastocatellia bacterium]
MSYRFRILALITFAALAVSAMGSAIPLRSISNLLESALPGFAKPIREREVKLLPPSNVAPPIQTDSEAKPKQGDQFTIYQNAEGEVACRAATAAEKAQMEKP